MPVARKPPYLISDCGVPKRLQVTVAPRRSTAASCSVDGGTAEVLRTSTNSWTSLSISGMKT
jgi:hypothetical protein